MALESELYFGMILLAVAVTGLLAWQASKQRSLAGNRYYFWLALAMCVAALEEVFSMLSITQAGALFWFKMRFLSFAVIPPLWVLFVLEYTGRHRWLSKGLAISLFAVPLITQAIIWTSPWQTLWVQREVGFRQVGAFWVAELSQRIPGLWYLVHSFYGQLLMLAGSAMLLLEARRMARLHRLQAGLLIASALLPVVIAVVITFNLLPKDSLNPTIPGFALAAALAAAAVFRFDFLKKAPEMQSAEQWAETQERRMQTLFLGILGLMATGVLAVGTLSYVNFLQHFRTQVDEQMTAIAMLKIRELQNWRTERSGDAAVLRQNAAFAALLQDFLTDPNDLSAAASLQAWLDSLCKAYGYETIYFLDTGGTQRIASPAGISLVDAHLQTDMNPVLQDGQVVFWDFHFHQPDRSIHLGLLVPIYVEQDLSQPLGVLIMEVHPQQAIYPFLAEWPVPSQTAETLLVRREGDEVLFLNPVRFDPAAALSRRYPLTQTDLLAVKAVSGQTGVVEGVDYRDAAVVGYVGPVPGSPWFLVARQDSSEAFAPIQERFWQTMLLFGALVTATGSGFWFIWRRQRLRYYRDRYEAAEALRFSEERFRKAFQITPDAVSITRLADGRLLSVNPGFEQILGYSEQEVLGKTSVELGIWVNAADRIKIVEGLQAGGSVLNYEAQFQGKDGKIVDGLMSAAVFEIAGEAFIISTTRDITERKRIEVETMRLSRVYAVISQINQMIVRTRDPQEIFRNICHIAVEFGEFRMAWVGLVDQQSQVITPVFWDGVEEGYLASIPQVSVKDVPEGLGPAGVAARTGRTDFCNDIAADPRTAPWRAEALKRGYRSLVALPIVVDAHTLGIFAFYAGEPSFFNPEEIKLLEEVASDINFALEALNNEEKRKLAEEALRDSEDKFRYIFDHSLVGISMTLPAGGINVNPAFCDMLVHLGINSYAERALPW
ncbi:MAG: histidine kinase N-terminal 7TM domain-containing protein [Chloroflexota bacterium]